MPRWVLRIYWRPPLRSTPVPGSALAFSTGVQHWRSALAFITGVHHWRSALRSNSFLGQISEELYIREPSSITPVWGSLGYGKNRAPTPLSFSRGSRRYSSRLTHAQRSAKSLVIARYALCFLRWGVPCLVTCPAMPLIFCHKSQRS